VARPVYGEGVVHGSVQTLAWVLAGPCMLVCAECVCTVEVLRIAHTQHTLTCASSMAQARGSQGTTPTTQANTRTTRSNQGSPQPPGSTGQTSPSRGAAALGVTTAAKRLPPPLPSLRTLRTRFQPVGVLAKKTLAKNPAKAQRENQGQGEPGQHRDGEGVCLPRMHCLPLVATRAAHARAR